MPSVSELLMQLESNLSVEIAYTKSDLREGATAYELGRLEGLEEASNLIDDLLYQYDAMCEGAAA